MAKKKIGLYVVLTILGVVFIGAGLSLGDQAGSSRWAMILAGVVLILVSIVSIVKSRKEAPKNDVSKAETVDLRNVLVGMAKAKGKVDLEFIAKELDMKVNTIEMRVYDLVGAGKLEGTIEGKVFTPSGDMTSAIDALLAEFENWDGGKV